MVLCYLFSHEIYIRKSFLIYLFSDIALESFQKPTFAHCDESLGFLFSGVYN